MTISTFFTATLITILILVIIRYHWYTIALIGVVLTITVRIIVLSFLSMMFWACFITQSAKGWELTFLYFLILYSGCAVVLYIIAGEMLSMAVDFIKKLFR